MASKAKQQKKLDRVQAEQQKNNLVLKSIQPLTENQHRAFRSFSQSKHLFQYGCAGTGKTFLALYFALSKTGPNSTYKHVYIVRSDVATRKQGYLPGKLKEKNEVHELPYYSSCSKLYGRGDAYDILKSKNVVSFLSTSYLRGTDFNDCFVIVDECQNMTAHELDTVMTRVGQNCKIMFCGDMRQNDLRTNPRDVSGFGDFVRILNEMGSFDLIEYGLEDIVRGPDVKQYITARYKLEDAGAIAALA